MIRRLSVAEQTTAYLREGLQVGQWSGKLPGVPRLALELDVSPPTIRVALRQLEVEGLLITRGPGRCRTISDQAVAKRQLRVGILMHDMQIKNLEQSDLVMLRVQHQLEAAGHRVFTTGKSQFELNHDVQLIARSVKNTPADAWIVSAGYHELLEWFANQATPTIALYGHSEGVPLARTGPDKVPAMLSATRQLIKLGHRRIVMIAGRGRRTPTPGNVEQAFLNELTAHGISIGPFNLPDWEETPKGLHSLLGSLFTITPPTALIIQEAPRVIAALQFFSERGIRVPEQVSLISTDYDHSLAWCHRVVAHMEWHNTPIIRRIVRWVAAVRQGRADCKTINYPATFIAGDTIGPAL